MRSYLLFTTMLFALVLQSCSSDNDESDVPKGTNQNKEYPVSITINMNSGKSDGELLFGRVSKIITEPRTISDKLGNKGLIVYSDNDSKVTVFDLACPNCWNGTILSKVVMKPAYRYECKVCGLDANLDYGRGFIRNDKGEMIKSTPLVQYEVTSKEIRVFDISNPK